MAKTKGIENFIDASDEFYDYLAEIIRDRIKEKVVDLKTIRELSEIIKVNSGSMKAQTDEPSKKKSPMEKIKARSSTGEQTVV